MIIHSIQSFINKSMLGPSKETNIFLAQAKRFEKLGQMISNVDQTVQEIPHLSQEVSEIKEIVTEELTEISSKMLTKDEM
jgi:uncharacterized protein YoxC